MDANKFATQKLTKKQMNEVIGGTKFRCMVVLSTEEINNPHDAPKYYDELIIEANTAREAEISIWRKYADQDKISQVTCKPSER